MRYFLAAAAATMAFAVVAASSVGAKAEYYYGPIQNGNQCWVKRIENGAGNVGWGYWTECPKPASTAVEAAPKKKNTTQR
jgi:hypothetical protein